MKENVRWKMVKWYYKEQIIPIFLKKTSNCILGEGLVAAQQCRGQHFYFTERKSESHLCVFTCAYVDLLLALPPTSQKHAS